MRSADGSRHRPLEPRHLRSRGQPVGAQRGDHGLHVVLVDGLPPVGQERPPHGRAAVDREPFTHRRALSSRPAESHTSLLSLE